MIMKCFAVFDSKAAVFMAPFFCKNAGIAVRDFTDVVNGEGNAISNHPEDYTLYELGSVDDGTGILALTQTTRPEVIATASSVKKVNQFERMLPGIDKVVEPVA